jgi:hypothetical protein
MRRAPSLAAPAPPRVGPAVRRAGAPEPPLRPRETTSRRRQPTLRSSCTRPRCAPCRFHATRRRSASAPALRRRRRARPPWRARHESERPRRDGDVTDRVTGRMRSRRRGADPASPIPHPKSRVVAVGIVSPATNSRPWPMCAFQATAGSPVGRSWSCTIATLRGRSA